MKTLLISLPLLLCNRKISMDSRFPSSKQGRWLSAKKMQNRLTESGLVVLGIISRVPITLLPPKCRSRIAAGFTKVSQASMEKELTWTTQWIKGKKRVQPFFMAHVKIPHPQSKVSSILNLPSKKDPLLALKIGSIVICTNKELSHNKNLKLLRSQTGQV